MRLLLRFSIEDLYLLVLLNQGLTISLCAKKLYISQPAISQKLKRLRDVLDCPLHEASGRTARLTDEGKKLAEATLLALQILDAGLPVKREPPEILGALK